MKPDVLARYTEILVGPAFVAAHLACNLCGKAMAAGDRAALIPANDDEMGRMHLALPYCGVMAHYDCLRKLP